MNDEYKEIMKQSHLYYEKTMGNERILTQEILRQIKPIVNNYRYKAILEWIYDKENGILGNFEIVTEPKGEWE